MNATDSAHCSVFMKRLSWLPWKSIKRGAFQKQNENYRQQHRQEELNQCYTSIIPHHTKIQVARSKTKAQSGEEFGYKRGTDTKVTREI